MKILFDSVYVHNGGGKEILDLLISEIIILKKENLFYFLFDTRYTLSSSVLNKLNFSSIPSGEISRKRFYKENRHFKSYFCLSNVPPPIHVNKPCSIYFHNDLLINPFKTNLNLNQVFKNILKKAYIRSKSKNHYEWSVQTNLMKEKLSIHHNISKKQINVFPIFDESIFKKKKNNDSFLFVSNYSKHKNHKRLLDAFIDVAHRKKNNITLKITLSEYDFKRSCYNKKRFPNNLNINNLGILSKKELKEVYINSKFLIFPSLNESFGLPLIEATNMGCYTIVSDLDYVDQVIKPSIKFNPLSVKSISNAIIESLTSESLNTSKPIIDNKIDIFVKYLTSNV